LSFEHVPPRAAFNRYQTITIPFEKAITLGPDAEPRGPVEQRGSGGYTLCERCNNNTGSWYASHFVDWCYQAADLLIKSKGRPSLAYLYYLWPLRVIKQIITMFFTVNNPNFHKKHRELVRFVLSRKKSWLPPSYRLFAYYTLSPRIRQIGISGRIDFATSRVDVRSEMSYPPFGYVLTVNSAPPDDRLTDITYCAQFGYNEFRVMPLRLALLPVQSMYPGDYRNRKQIMGEAQAEP